MDIVEDALGGAGGIQGREDMDQIAPTVGAEALLI